MLILIAYTLAALGLAYIVGHSVISLPIRQWLGDLAKEEKRATWLRWSLALFLEMIECPACFGFWIGFCSGLFTFGSFIWAVGLGIYTCATNLILGKLVGLME